MGKGKLDILGLAFYKAKGEMGKADFLLSSSSLDLSPRTSDALVQDPADHTLNI